MKPLHLYTLGEDPPADRIALTLRRLMRWRYRRAGFKMDKPLNTYTALEERRLQTLSVRTMEDFQAMLRDHWRRREARLVMLQRRGGFGAFDVDAYSKAVKAEVGTDDLAHFKIRCKGKGCNGECWTGG